MTYIEFKWPLEKIIEGLCGSSGNRFRRPARSRTFLCTTEEKIQSIWRLELKSTDSCIEIKVCLTDAASNNHFLSYFEVTLKSQNDCKWASFQKKEVFNMDKPDYCINPFMCMKALQYLHEQNLSFTVIFKMELQLIGCKINSDVPLSVPDFENLMYDTEFSDLILIASGKQFKVHKNILAARSKVFSNIIKHIMRERKDNIIYIEDFDDKVIQELIRYIYCGRVENLNKLSKSLLKVAEKYVIEGLKIICLQEFCRSLTVKNACKLLVLLDEYKVDHLKSQVLDFIVHHLQHISKSDFVSFKNPNLLREVFFKTVSVYVKGNGTS